MALERGVSVLAIGGWLNVKKEPYSYRLFLFLLFLFWRSIQFYLERSVDKGKA
jgi:hypothetical protein